MIDYIGLLVLAIALFIGFFPLLFKKNRSGDFLIYHPYMTTQEDMKEEEEERERHRWGYK